MSAAVARWAVLALAAVATVAVQVSVLSRLPLPGATPDLVAVLVVGVGLVAGSSPGAAVGFGVGLLLDVAPGIDGVLGRWALCLTLAGWVAGLLSARVAGPSRRAPWATAVGVMAGLAAATVMGSWGLTALLAGDARTAPGAMQAVRLLPTQALYAAVLSLAVLPALAALERRTGPARRMRRPRPSPAARNPRPATPGQRR